ncbi:MAG: hypothetical protein E7473_10900 [Ruminococcaceae bacterium]|nr:hypothetical protein [Oscillospiraceae bacterium]
MKKIISLMIGILVLMSLFIVSTVAEDSNVSYALSLEATAPRNGETYAIGETVTITVAVSTRDAMGNPGTDIVPAPIYAFNGVLHYNSYLMSLTNTVVRDYFNTMICKNNAAEDKITFSYLCSSVGQELSGANVGVDFILAKFTFKTLNDGISAITLSDIVLTDKNANARPIVSTSNCEINIGTGEVISDPHTLIKSIENAKKQLNDAIMNPASEIVYPAFTVTQATYDALSLAIKEAEKALELAVLPDEFLEAEKALTNALYLYEDAKIYGRKPGDVSGVVGGFVAGGGKEKNLIEVTAVAGEHGKIVQGYEKQLVRNGTSATVQAVPDEGYAVEKVIVNGMQYPADETVTIASVTAKTHVEFYFNKKTRFKDVARGSWYFDAVEKIAEMGLFTGTSATEFSPDMPMTRAMLVTVLHRLDGKESTVGQVTFKDVASGTWYTEAIAWASANKIVNGYSANTFGTNDSISRQDMVTILYRYLKYKGVTPEGGASLNAYKDADKVSDYAKAAMEWAYSEGLVKGTSDTTLSPKDNCTRAQVATIILRYISNITAQ